MPSPTNTPMTCVDTFYITQLIFPLLVDFVRSRCPGGVRLAFYCCCGRCLLQAPGRVVQTFVQIDAAPILRTCWPAWGTAVLVRALPTHYSVRVMTVVGYTLPGMM